jgi:hypothetical protein
MAKVLVRVLLGAALLGACRGAPRTNLDAGRLSTLVDSLIPAVETAVGLPFKTAPVSALTTGEAVQAYLLDRIQRDFPTDRMEGITAAYRLFGLIPDSLDLKALLLSVYQEQVAGYYDPDTEILYAVEGSDPAQLRLILAHELVHALQHQYLPLDSLMVLRGNGDVVAATQAVLEGHATLASIRVLAPIPELLATEEFWDSYRQGVLTQQRNMPVFGQAPLVLREGLVFPYLAGAEFVRWWETSRGRPLPDVAELPRSTEQILHPDRYDSADQPVSVVFADSSADLMYEDTLGELEVQIFLAQLRGADQVGFDAAVGWGGDRYRVYRTADGPALVWYSVWDGASQAARAVDRLSVGGARLARKGYRFGVEQVAVDESPAVRLILAPTAWGGWAQAPRARLRRP